MWEMAWVQGLRKQLSFLPQHPQDGCVLSTHKVTHCPRSHCPAGTQYMFWYLGSLGRELRCGVYSWGGVSLTPCWRWSLRRTGQRGHWGRALGSLCVHTHRGHQGETHWQDTWETEAVILCYQGVGGKEHAERKEQFQKR